MGTVDLNQVAASNVSRAMACTKIRCSLSMGKIAALFELDPLLAADLSQWKALAAALEVGTMISSATSSTIVSTMSSCNFSSLS